MQLPATLVLEKMFQISLNLKDFLWEKCELAEPNKATLF